VHYAEIRGGTLGERMVEADVKRALTRKKTSDWKSR
jgi:hypothetical protein